MANGIFKYLKKEKNEKKSNMTNIIIRMPIQNEEERTWTGTVLESSSFGIRIQDPMYFELDQYIRIVELGDGRILGLG